MWNSRDKLHELSAWLVSAISFHLAGQKRTVTKCAFATVREERYEALLVPVGLEMILRCCRREVKGVLLQHRSHAIVIGSHFFSIIASVYYYIAD